MMLDMWHVDLPFGGSKMLITKHLSTKTPPIFREQYIELPFGMGAGLESLYVTNP